MRWMTKSNQSARDKVRKRDGWQCRYCRCRVYNAVPWWGKAWRITIDHVQPLFRNGQETVDNMVVACQACNETKSSQTWEPKSRPLKPLSQMKWPGDVTAKRPSHADLTKVCKEDDRVRQTPLVSSPRRRYCPSAKELEEALAKAV